MLFDAVRSRTRKSVMSGLRNAGLMTVLFGFLWWRMDRLSLYSISFLLMIILGVLPVLQWLWQLFRLTRLTPEAMAGWVDSIRYEAWLREQRAPVTIALIVGLAAIFIGQFFVDELVWPQLVALDKEAVRNGDIVTLLTATMVHGGVVHMLFNGAALHYLGRPTELLAGRWMLLLVLVISMLCGSLLSVWLVPVGASVGASGGIIGLLGFLVMLGIRHRQVLPDDFARSMMANVVLIACVGIAGWKLIDNAGHLGGLVGGLICGALLIPRGDARLPIPTATPIRIAGWVALAYLVAAAALTVSKLALKW